MNCTGFGITTICKDAGWGCAPPPAGNLILIKNGDVYLFLHFQKCDF